MKEKAKKSPANEKTRLKNDLPSGSKTSRKTKAKKADKLKYSFKAEPFMFIDMSSYDSELKKHSHATLKSFLLSAIDMLRTAATDDYFTKRDMLFFNHEISVFLWALNSTRRSHKSENQRYGRN